MCKIVGHIHLIMLVALLLGCGGEHNKESYSLSNLNPHNNDAGVILTFDFKYCNGESYDLYLSIVHKDITTDPPRETLNGQLYLSDTHGWTQIPARTCITFTKASTNFVRAYDNFFILRTDKKLYIPAPSESIDYSKSNFEFCLARNIDFTQTITFEVEENRNTGVGKVSSCGDSMSIVKANSGLFKVFGFQEGESAWQNGRLDWGRYTFTNGRLIDDPNDGLIVSNNDLLQQIRDLENELNAEKEKLKGCEQTIGRLVSKNLLDLKPNDFDPILAECSERDSFEGFKKRFLDIRQLAKGILNGLADSLKEIYQSASVAAPKLGITEPLNDDIEAAGLSYLTRPNIESELKIQEPGFFGRVSQAYLSALSAAMAEKSRDFFTAVLTFSDTLENFGRRISDSEVIGHDRYLDYTGSLESYQNFFETVDLGTGEYGYPIDTPVPSEIRDLVHDELIPLDAAEGMAIESELKSWSGSLTVKRKEMLETLADLVKARIAMKKKTSEESANALLKLRAITAGLREGLQESAEFGKCIAVSTAFNDFADLYSVVNKRDICTGEELTTTGQVISAMGIVAGTSRVWRELADEAGFAVRTQKALKDANESLDSASSILGSKEGIENFISIVKTDTVSAGERLQDTIKNVKHPQIWTNTKKLSSVKNAYEHYRKHRSEFPQYKNAIEYVEGAHDFMRNPPAGTLVKSRANGEKVFYHQQSETFAVLNSDEIPKTMFKPDPAKHGYPTNLDYFNAQ